jgi:hypothetical protein
MKGILYSALLIQLAAHAQGDINLGNLSNAGNNSTPTATTGGLFWINAGGGPVLLSSDFNVSFYGGSNATSLIHIKTFVASGGGAAGGPGTFLDLSGVPVGIPGAPDVGYFKINAWIGAATFETALARGSTPVFTNPLGNPRVSPPRTPTDFTHMPAIVIIPAIPPTLAVQSTNGIRVTINGIAGVSYVLEATGSIEAPSWVPVHTNTSPFSFTETGSATQQFYRAVIRL